MAAGRGDHENEFTDRITFSLNRLSKDEDPLVREQLEFTFESAHSRFDSLLGDGVADEAGTLRR